jgi:hypothetical protein
LVKEERMALRRLSMTALLVVFVLAMSAGVARGNALPQRAHPYGATYGQWSAAWWQWALSFPLSDHPLDPAQDQPCSAGQSGRVWFVGGVVNSGGTVTRDCVVPSGTPLVVAVANVECSTLEGAPFGGNDEASLRACAAGVIDPSSPLFITGQHATLDGRALRPVRAPSPLFAFTVPSLGDNILACPATGCQGTSGEAVADGYMLVLPPLSVGTHELRFGGTFPAFGFTLDITYHLTVVPRHGRS